MIRAGILEEDGGLQLVRSMLPNSLKKRLLAWAEVMPEVRASSRAITYCRDSGRHARTMAAAREKPAPMKYSDRQVYLDSATTVRLITAARR